MTPATITLPAPAAPATWCWKRSAMANGATGCARLSSTSNGSAGARSTSWSQFQPRPDREEVVSERFLNLSVDPRRPALSRACSRTSRPTSRAACRATASARERRRRLASIDRHRLAARAGGSDGNALTDADVEGRRNAQDRIYALLEEPTCSTCCASRPTASGRGARARPSIRRRCRYCVEKRARC